MARILIIDDSLTERTVITSWLTKAGHVAMEAAEAEAGIALALQQRPDLILMDVHMPNMDGLEASRRIRALEGPVGRTPIIALTANVQPDQIEACSAAGMDAHVGKPIRPTELLTAMNAVMTARAVETDAAAA